MLPMHPPPALAPPRRVLMGPGPSDVDDAVLSAMARPTLGHLDPEFLRVMDEIRSMLRDVFRTRNELTMPMSGTGSAGMETCMANLLEPGDRVLVGVNGVFGTRMAEVARRCGAEVTEVKGEWGRAFTADALRGAAETSGASEAPWVPLGLLWLTFVISAGLLWLEKKYRA